MNLEFKRRKLLEMLKVLGEDNNFFDDLIVLVENVNLNDSLIDGLYDMIDSSIEKVKAKLKDDGLKRLLDIQRKLNLLRAKEETDVEDFDGILNKLD